jgi:hypothetical protein
MVPKNFRIHNRLPDIGWQVRLTKRPVELLCRLGLVIGIVIRREVLRFQTLGCGTALIWVYLE